VSERAGTRERLLALAADRFAAEGYGATSLRDLASAAKVTTGAIYGNFGSKADLLLAAIDAEIAEQLVRVPPPEVATIADILATVFAAHPERKRLRALLVEGAVAARSDAELGAAMIADQQARLDEWAEIYEEWQRRHEIASSLDVRSVVQMLWAAELGLGVMESMGLALPEGGDTGEIFRHFVIGLRAQP
jgi:AcrR family transcriptional regulator